MASKHDAKKARESYFAMQQNLARHKGQAFWMQKPKQPKIAANAKAKKAKKPEPAPAEEPEATEQATGDEDETSANRTDLPQK